MPRSVADIEKDITYTFGMSVAHNSTRRNLSKLIRDTPDGEIRENFIAQEKRVRENESNCIDLLVKYENDLIKIKKHLARNV